jgi:hypothetical protein
MKNLIWEFLDAKYPNSFIKKSIFGELACCNDEYLVGYRLCEEISKWFDISYEDAAKYMNMWYSTLPVVVSIRK